MERRSIGIRFAAEVAWPVIPVPVRRYRAVPLDELILEPVDERQYGSQGRSVPQVPEPRPRARVLAG